jgi:hypothetical protein
MGEALKLQNRHANAKGSSSRRAKPAICLPIHGRMTLLEESGVNREYR